ncbi:hypothetical protein M501DRAFT_994563 [Patellaria atrata CBS 101060]|uniref:Flavin reductase like domain-containing protein n=1 Tax=Patellaria atrata CBS 101060 TaxID=1346257 RepID=A0A9P4SJC3_9PEZI|nr:hypothetical protein M501DRAFT_994563 [Patellaria atrata CBS 101060]
MSTPKADAEVTVRRNPHPDFPAVEASRPLWHEHPLTFTQQQNPSWKLGDGADDGGKSLKLADSPGHREIDPYEEGRPAVFNYKLMISAVVPRPIGWVGTRTKEGTTNLAPFSYFNMMNHDPPIFTLGFSGGFARPKDTLSILVETGECTINIISEPLLAAANSTSINAPLGISEFALSGLHEASCTLVSAPRIKEAVFSVEGKLLETKEYESRHTPGKKTGVVAIVEGLRFWVRRDAVDEDGKLVNPGVLRPMARMGGISYGKVTEVVEIPRPQWEEVARDKSARELVGSLTGQRGL